MTNTRNCPECGAVLPADATEAMCPQCQLASGYAGSATASRLSAQRTSQTGSDQITDAPTIPPQSDSNPATLAVPDAVVLRRIGDYELLEEIARGGMGVVYKARQTSLNRVVAVKMILAGQLASEEDVRRFRREAESAANLDHSGIVPVFEVGEHDGQHYFSMGYVDGSSLSEEISHGPLPPREAARIVKQVADAVEFAHRQDVIHRDLKPANVLIDQNGHPKITDFGVAKRITGERGHTATGHVLGTPEYMPPEQAGGKIEDIGPAVDIYSLGAILYSLITGRPPFQSASPMDTLLQVLEQDPVPLRQLNATVPLDLQTVCLKCLEKDPRRRYASAQELSAELQRFLNSEPIHARPASMLDVIWKWCVRFPVIAVFAGFYLLIYVISFIGLVGLITEQKRLVDAAGECLSNALSCSAFGAILGIIGTVSSNILLRHLPAKAALMRGFLYGSAVGGYTGVFVIAANALGQTLKVKNDVNNNFEWRFSDDFVWGILGFSWWAALMFGIFQNPDRRPPARKGGRASSTVRLPDLEETILRNGRRACLVSLGVFIAGYGWLLYTTGAQIESETSHTGMVIKNLMTVPLTTTSLAILGTVAGMLGAAAGGLTSHRIRGTSLQGLFQRSSAGGQIGMIGGTLSGMLIVLAAILASDVLEPESAAKRVRQLAPWMLLIAAVLPGIIRGCIPDRRVNEEKLR